MNQTTKTESQRKKPVQKLVTLLALIMVLSVSIPLTVNASTVKPAYVQTGEDSLQLTVRRVGDWIRTRIATARLQNKMKANASQYDDVVQAFFAERKKLLESRGWTPAEFDGMKKRIHAAISAMETADELAASEKEHQKEIAEIKSNTFYSVEQKRQMIEGLEMVRRQQRDQFIEPTRADWPAVKPHRDTLEHLTSWIAGNRPDPPEVE